MRRKVIVVAVVLFLALFILAWAHKAYWDGRYFENYDPGAPLNVAILDNEEVNKDTPEKGYVITSFAFDGYKGEKVPALMSVPMKRTGKKLPAIIFLHGIGQNKKFLREITAPFNQTGFAFASFDQYSQGERKLPQGTSLIKKIRAFQQRPGKTINETRRFIDYLSANSDIDPDRIYLVGASYGAVMGSTVMAFDKRIRAGVLVYGGGDFGKLFNSYANHIGLAVALHLINAKDIDVNKGIAPKLTASQRCITGAIIACIIPGIRYFAGVADPIHYVGQIAPTPVYFQNGSNDMLVPADAAKALQDAAKEPKKITWYDSNHVGFDIEQTKGVLTDGLRWLLEQDNPFRAPEEKVTELPPFEAVGKK